MSPVLRALLRKIGTKKAEIHLPDEEPDIFDLCVEWLFTRAVTLIGEKSKFEDDVTTDCAAITAGQGNSKTNAGDNSGSDNGKGDDDDFLDEHITELMADIYSVNALPRHVEKRLAKLCHQCDAWS